MTSVQLRSTRSDWRSENLAQFSKHRACIGPCRVEADKKRAIEELKAARERKKEGAEERWVGLLCCGLRR